MKTLYLHIGTPKTATSSLQKFLDINQEMLRENNYSYRIFPFSYPNVGKRRNGYFLSGPGINKTLTEEDSRGYQEHLQSGLDFIKDQFSTCDNVILTDEHLWFAMNYSQWDPLQILMDHANKNGYQIKIIVYLRRQDKFEISRWNQFAKARNYTKSLKSHIQNDFKDYPLILFYGQALDKIAERIGKENISVRRYDTSCWPSGSIFSDFQAALNLPNDIPFEYPQGETNQGLKYNFLDMKLRINHNIYLNEEQKTLFTKYIRQASDSREEHDEYGLLSPDETRQFLSNFEEENAYVAKEYIGDGKPLFSDQIREVKKWVPENEYMLDDVNFFLSLLPEDLRKIYYAATILDLQTKVRDLEEKASSQEYTIQLLRKIRHPIRSVEEKFSRKTKE